MNRITRIALAVATTALAATGLAACGSSSSSGSASPTSAGSAASASSSASAASPSAMASSSSGSTAASATIMIKDFEYTGTTAVKAGSKVEIMNMDSQAHTVTADSGSAFDVKVDPGATVTLTAPSKPGSYAYHCTFHANMHGMLKVS